MQTVFFLATAVLEQQSFKDEIMSIFNSQYLRNARIMLTKVIGNVCIFQKCTACSIEAIEEARPGPPIHLLGNTGSQIGSVIESSTNFYFHYRLLLILSHHSSSLWVLVKNHHVYTTVGNDLHTPKIPT